MLCFKIKKLTDELGQITVENKITLRKYKGYKVVNCNDITYCEADGRYTIVHFNEAKSIMVAKLLKHFEINLPDETFLRIHKSHLVNINYISEYNSEDKDMIILEGNVSLEISKRRKKDTLEKLKNRFTFL